MEFSQTVGLHVDRLDMMNKEKRGMDFFNSKYNFPNLIDFETIKSGTKIPINKITNTWVYK